jgi:integrase
VIYRRKRSPFYWIKFSQDGRIHRESTRTTDAAEAKRRLRIREGAVAAGLRVTPRLDRLRYEDLAAALVEHVTTTGCRKLKEVEGRLRPLARHFSGGRVPTLEAAVPAYSAKRKAAEVTPAGINRELALLRRMLRLGYKLGTVQRLPTFSLLKEAAPRSGFFEEAELDAVRAHLAPDLQVAVDLAHRFGWRMRQTVLHLERRHVDLDAGTISLDLTSATTKSEAALVYLTPALMFGLRAQLARVEALGRTLDPPRIVPWLFPKADGSRRVDLRKAWDAACRKASVGRLKHDLRRTAVRNLVRVGIPERVAMTITGHRTRSVFDRYTSSAPRTSRRPPRSSRPWKLGTLLGTLGLHRSRVVV